MDAFLGIVFIVFFGICLHGAFLIVQDKERDWHEKKDREKDKF